MTTLAGRMAAKTARTRSCWLWTACLNSKGYGVVSVRGKRQLAHRVAYEAAHGPIAPGLVIDHTCGVRRCVNPAHLEQVTTGENNRRSRERARRLRSAA